MTSWQAEFGEAFAGQRSLVTGASGFVGSHLVRTLISLGCSVVTLDRPGTNWWRLADIKHQFLSIPSEVSHLDVTTLANQLSGIKYMYHLAAHGVNPDKANPYDIISTNILGTLQMLQLARHLGVKRFVYSGSCFEYGSGLKISEDVRLAPRSEYGVSKAAGTMLTNMFHQRYGVPTVSLRLFTPYGSFDSRHRLIPHVIVSALNRSEIKISGGEQSRDFVYIEDVIEVLLRASIINGVEGNVFNVCTGQAIKIKYVVEKVLEIMDCPLTPHFGALPYRDNEIWTLSGNPAKASDYLKWTAKTRFDEGLSNTIRWFRYNSKIYQMLT